MEVSGNRSILTAERTALNFLQRMSGIATLTRQYVDAIKGTRAKIYDTRKTLPGWRLLDKYAVTCGGGYNHRMGLYDAVMVKDNHYFGGNLERGVQNLRRKFSRRVPLYIECETPQQVDKAMRLRPSVILLDNMKPSLLRREIRRIRQTAPSISIEVSGGIDLRTIRSIARLGPDRISIGRLTHSAPALDLGLDL
jgi:nicotinate-nucleotide pyrophosphorylase (carboxylating)